MPFLSVVNVKRFFFLLSLSRKHLSSDVNLVALVGLINSRSISFRQSRETTTKKGLTPPHFLFWARIYHMCQDFDLVEV